MGLELSSPARCDVRNLKKETSTLLALGNASFMGDCTWASCGMNTQSYPLPTVAGMIEDDIIAYISLGTAMSPWIQLATWLQWPCK